MPHKPQAHSPATGRLSSDQASEAVTIDEEVRCRNPAEQRARRAADLLDLALSDDDDASGDPYVRWTPAAGSRVGRYELLRQLGEGGFGIVWLAVQRDDIQREVALKLIKPGMDSRQITARFEAERQALAVMDHPNIAQVLDAGTAPDAHPFFVMELVRGVPITEFCDSRQMDVRERLQLFVQVCHGVQHAHQKAILHRDLKPSNILVEEVDGAPVPKIIDFGIAKALGGGSARTASQTNSALTGRWAIMGTAQYMSPEQAASESDVDACSDIFSLGVVLFELLTGSTPIPQESFTKIPLEEILRRIRDSDAPKPSSLFLPGNCGPAEIKAAANRRSDARRLAQELRGDLDWMVLTALEKDRHRRYESAAAFAQDVRRHLQHELVLARPPTTSYVLGRLIRRNQAAFVSALFVSLAVLTACAVAMWSYVNQNDAIKQKLDAEQRAARERDKSQQVDGFLGKMIQDISLGDDSQTLDPAAIRDLLRAAEERRKLQLWGNPEADLRVSLMLAEAHMQQGSSDMAAQLYSHALARFEELGQGDTQDAADCIRLLVTCRHRHREETNLALSEEDDLRLIDRCATILRERLPDTQEKLWEAEALRIGLLRGAGKTAEARERLEQLFMGPEGERLSASRASGWILRERAILRGEAGEDSAALDDLNHSLRLLKGLTDAGKQNPERLLNADASRIRTAIYLRAGDFVNALGAATEVERIRRAMLGHDDPFAVIRLADVLIRQKNFDTAVKRLKDALTVAENTRSLHAQEACLKQLLAAATASGSASLTTETMTTRTRLARVILTQADQRHAATGLTDDARVDEAAALLTDANAGTFATNVDAAEFHATRASIAVRREDFPAAIRDLHRADALDPDNPTHRVGSAIFALAAGDAALYESERAELIARISSGAGDARLFDLCCAVLLRPAVEPAQLAQVRERLEKHTNDDLDSERQEFINGLLEFREGPAKWETARSWLDALRRSEHPEVAVASRLVMAMGLHRATDDLAASELHDGMKGYDEFFARALGADSEPKASVVWFVRLLMREAEDMIESTQ